VENGHSGGALIDQQARIIGIVNQTGGSTPQALRIDRALDVLRLDLKLPVQLAAGTPPPSTRTPPNALTDLMQSIDVLRTAIDEQVIQPMLHEFTRDQLVAKGGNPAKGMTDEQAAIKLAWKKYR
jgi:hypothetical protein